MSSPSVSLPAPPWRGAAAIFALWIALWSFFILAVAAPAAQLHRASSPIAAVAAAEPQSDRRR
jgi:hypothetical protein